MTTDQDELTARHDPGQRRPAGLPTLVAVLALVASLVAIGVGVHANSNKGVGFTHPNVGVVEKDFAIQAPVATVKGGLVDFTVANSGPSPHEFLIFRASQAPDQLPLGSDGRVDESSSDITKVFDSGDNISPGGSKVFHAALTPGTYVMVCNLPGHYKAGMHTTLTVN